MNLNEIIKNLQISKITGPTDIEISDIIYDSRKTIPGCIFACLEGFESDGHKFINDAVNRGAKAIVVQKETNIAGITVILVKNTRKALAEMSVNFFKHPADEITTIGITGTKGKTTTSFMIKSVLEAAKNKVGLIGTLGVIAGDETIKLDNTTPESYEVQKYLRHMVENGCNYAIMETSSRGLEMNRVDGFNFNYGVFSNFSSDHIGGNEHKDLDEYLNCKSLLFKKCDVGFLNKDDEKFSDIIKNHTCKIKTFGFDKFANYTASDAKLVSNPGCIGVDFKVSGEIDLDIHVSIPGKFNIYNALAAISVCNHIGIDSHYIKQGLAKAKVKGRVEPVHVSNEFSLFIDYAHNSFSMENILITLREYEPNRLITLFGAGGNRPKARRYEMGEVSGKLSDLSVVTTDNPRFEEPMEIIEDIITGLKRTNGKYTIIPDRKEAIRFCIENAQPNDIIVLAGKGHEDYQEIKGIKYHLDEREVIQSVLAKFSVH